MTMLPAPATDHPVWLRLQGYEPGPLSATLPFTWRLARENGWSPARATRVVEEYRRFCFLAVTAGHPVTPSDAVDQAWHLHLLYTRDYWERFCPDILGRPLHHGPTTGGPVEQHRFFEQYADTLLAYEQAFGTAPPADLWPNAHRRLVQDSGARRVHPRDALVVPWRWAAMLSGAMLVVALGTAGMLLAR